MKALWSSQYKSIAPSDFKSTVGRFKIEFAGRDQQDSHEFVSKLLEWLHGDTNRWENCIHTVEGMPKSQLASVIFKTVTIRVQRPSKEPEQNWKDKMEVKAVLEQYADVNVDQNYMTMMHCNHDDMAIM